MIIRVKKRDAFIVILSLVLLALIPFVYSQVATPKSAGFGVWLVISNANPIIKLNNISVGNIDPSAAGAVAVRISFNVTDTNGISDINASKAVVNLTLCGLDGQFRANVSKQDTE